MRVVYMGTPDFAVNTLEAMIQAGHQVEAVVTQPDKPKGRGKVIQFTPVKEKALEYQIPVYQPVKVRDEEFIEVLEAINPDVIVVVAFGQILSERILNLPKYGCINVHASLLPKLRGSAPIQWAVINGEKESGVTTMYMDKGIDTGDMLLQTCIPLEEKETGGSLHDKLAEAGAALLVETLEKLEQGTVERIKQAEAESTYVKMLNKAMGNMDFSQSAKELDCLIRGLNPWPSAYTFLQGKSLKVYDADVVTDTFQGEPGEVVQVDKNAFTVKCGEGALKILNVQLEGKKRMDTKSFLAGFKVTVGEKLGKQAE